MVSVDVKHHVYLPTYYIGYVAAREWYSNWWDAADAETDRVQAGQSTEGLSK